MRVLADITVPAKLESLEGLVKSAIGSALQCGFEGEGLFAVELVTEEAVVNICKYSYLHGEGEVRLRCLGEEDRFIIEVTDWGGPFDATTMPAPDITSPIEERQVGGLGIYLIKKMTDDMSYTREDGRNVLRLFLSKTRSSGAPG
ncbi:MAG: ATP-binding protein [bacterium]